MDPVAARLAYKRRMPATELDDEHVRNCRILVNRRALLKALPKDAVAVEVGVDVGAFSLEILSLCRPKKLYLVDGWVSARYAENKAIVEEKLSDFLRDGAVELRQGLSVQVLNDSFDDHSVDWIYIDTDHSYGTTIEELEIGRKKVRHGVGRLAGHDFCTGNVVTPVAYGVIEACCAFCKTYGWEFEYLTLESHGHFSYCLREIV